jgi:hypothetical protein
MAAMIPTGTLAGGNEGTRSHHRIYRTYTRSDTDP